jgi:pimeloyl-ACP methyl ester carboxylesterase
LWGFGDSDKSKARYEVADYVDLVNNFANNMGIQEVPLIGHALGASVALEYAVQYPNRSDKIMAVSLPLNGDSISRRLIDFANDSMLAKMMWWRQLTHKEVQQEAEKAVKLAISKSVESVAKLNTPSRIQTISRFDKAMLLAVYGEKDDIVDPTPLGTLNGDWTNIRPIGLANSKHFPMLEEAAKFNRLLRDFLELEDDLAVLELKEEWRRRTR